MLAFLSAILALFPVAFGYSRLQVNTSSNVEVIAIDTDKINTSIPLNVVTANTGNTHLVDVGANGEFLFNPNNVDAAVGDLILFRFLKLNHTVTQSSFEHPCTPRNGFDTGFSFYNPLNQTGVADQLFFFLVRDSEPTWFFCHQTEPRSHCAAGMRFGVNVGDMMDQFLAMPDVSPNANYHRPRDSPSAFTQPQNWNASRTSTALGIFYTGYLSSGGLPGTSSLSIDIATVGATSGLLRTANTAPTTTSSSQSGARTQFDVLSWGLGSVLTIAAIYLSIS